MVDLLTHREALNKIKAIAEKAVPATYVAALVEIDHILLHTNITDPNHAKRATLGNNYIVPSPTEDTSVEIPPSR